MRIKLDYAQQSHGGSPLMWGAIGIAALLLCLLGWHAHQLENQLQGLEWRALAHKRTPASSSIPPAEQERIAQRIQEANMVMAELGLPWNDLFEHLENTASPQVSLLEIRPVAAKRNIRISGEARNVGALMDYVRDLEAQDAFEDVSIQEHQVESEGMEQSVGFRLQARWKTHS